MFTCYGVVHSCQSAAVSLACLCSPGVDLLLNGSNWYWRVPLLRSRLSHGV